MFAAASSSMVARPGRIRGRIRPGRATIDDEAAANIRIFRHQFLHHGERRILRLIHGEEKLEVWIVLLKEALQIVVQTRFHAMQRLQYGNGKKGLRQYRLPSPSFAMEFRRTK